MPTRARSIGFIAIAAFGIGIAVLPVGAQPQVHRHSFAGTQTVLVRGDANVRVEEKEHDISTLSFKSQPSSEHIKLTAEAATGETAFIHYHYDTPPAPVSELLTAAVWVKATKPGIQLRARVVFPKEPDPARPETPLSILIVGKTYEKTRAWDKLTIEEVPALVGKHLPAVQAKIGRNVNTADAYIDRLVLNVYAGPGPVDVWVDDLDIGPVKPTPMPDRGMGSIPGVTAKGLRSDDTGGRARDVQQRGGQLLVDGKPYFFRAIRHTGTPLHVLRAAGFNSLWLPPDADASVVGDAGREGWLIIPSAPRADFNAVSTAPEGTPFDAFRRKFATSDVLFWDLGGGLTDEEKDRVYRTTAEVLKGGRKRPVGGDLWDGFGAYSSYLDVVGAHRWPLFTSLELTQYRDWLMQRRTLIGGRPVFWTWVQNHLPDWYVANIASRPVDRSANPDTAFAGPVGPHPEQVRLLAYISLACGCRGLGFWSDRYLADSHHGRDRLQGMALLNAELDLLAPVLLSAGASGNRTQWLDTNHPNVKAAVISGQKGLVLLPIWMGPGDQYVPAQGAVTQLKVVVPTVPEGHQPWLITPAGVECLSHRAVRGPKGTELMIDEFDLVAPIVFTDDQTPTGLVVWWQDHARRYGRLAARWALDLAAEEYEKVRTVHVKLAGLGVELRGSERLFDETRKYYDEAQKLFANEQFDRAYRDATRALRPLRVVMREHWRLATEGLDVPTASPFAVSFFSLPQHWELARDVQTSQPSPSVLPYGNFELGGEIPVEGIAVGRVPGWTARTGSLETDHVVVAAGIVRSDFLDPEAIPREAPKLPRTLFSPSRRIEPADEGYTPPAPELGRSVLKLEARASAPPGREGKPTIRAQPLERTFLAVDSPQVRLAPGTLVRVSGWIRVPGNITGTVDGVLFYDDAGGEPLAVRISHTLTKATPQGGWRQFHLYRRVPETGRLSVTLALTGIGVAYFDDIRIEPLIVGAASTSSSRLVPPAMTGPGGSFRFASRPGTLAPPAPSRENLP